MISRALVNSSCVRGMDYEIGQVVEIGPVVRIRLFGGTRPHASLTYVHVLVYISIEIFGLKNKAKEEK